MANQRDYKFDVRTCSAVLQGLPRELRTSILGNATGAALQPIKRAAKQYARRSERTGALRDSIGDKVVKYPRNAVAVGLVGPVRGYYKKGKKLKSGASRRGADSPSHYAHLVEFGHHVASGGKRRWTDLTKQKRYTTKERTALALAGEAAHTGETRQKMTFVPAKPFLRPAGLTTKSEQSDQFYRGLSRGIDASRNKLAKGGVHKS